MKRIINVRSACIAAVAAVVAWVDPLIAQEASTPAESSTEISSYPVSRDALDRTLDDIWGVFQKIEAELDQSTYDPEALLDRLDYDADTIIEFASNDIVFEAYPGVLRGATGTLFSRAGNAIDQAILLAKLLRDAGYDARIAAAELAPDAAQAMLSELKRLPVIPGPFRDNEQINEILRGSDFLDVEAVAQTAAENTEGLASSRLYKLAEATSDSLIEKIAARGKRLGAPDASAAVLEEAQQYYWVEYRDSAASGWQAAHPVFQGAPPFEAPKATSYIAGPVPDSLLHRVRFQVFIERRQDGKLQTIPITTAWERPVANMIGVPMTYSNVADSMLSADSLRKDLREQASAASSYSPSFNGRLAPGGQFFNLDGTIIDPMAAQDAAAGLFATVNDAFRSAVGEIGDESTLPILTAQWLQFTFIAPGGEERVVRRMIFDRLGPAVRDKPQASALAKLNRASPEDARSLLQRHTFMVSASDIPSAFIVTSGIRRFAAARQGVVALYQLRAGESVEPSSIADVPAAWDGHLPLLALFSAGRSANAQAHSYRSGPALVIHSDGLGARDSRFEMMDIVANPVRSFDISGDQPRLAPEISVTAGVWETVAESLMLSGGHKSNTWTAMEAAREKGLDTVVVLPGESTQGIEASSDTLAALQRDLGEGYAVVVPERELLPGESGWWRIDPVTGETLGQFADGRGGEATEYKITMTVSLGAFAFGTYQCASSGYDPAAEICCQIANAGLAMATFGLGNYARIPHGGAVVTGKLFQAYRSIHNIGSSVGADFIASQIPAGGACAELLE